MKQQLPFKLAKLGGGGSSTSHTTLTGPPRDGGMQQMLPMKLSQAEARKATPGGGVPGGYQRLSSNSFGPASATAKENTPTSSPAGSAPTHVRTGSSPAMMQAHQPHSLPVGAGNTYPRPAASGAGRVTSPPTNPKAAPRATEEEVIFF